MQPNLQLLSDEEIKNLVDQDLITAMGGENIAPEKKAELYEQMGETVTVRALARIDDQLSDEEREEFKKLLDDEDQQKAVDFLKTKNIDITQTVAQEALIYKMEILSMFKAAKEDMAKE